MLTPQEIVNWMSGTWTMSLLSTYAMIVVVSLEVQISNIRTGMDLCSFIR